MIVLANVGECGATRGGQDPGAAREGAEAQLATPLERHEPATDEPYALRVNRRTTVGVVLAVAVVAGAAVALMTREPSPPRPCRAPPRQRRSRPRRRASPSPTPTPVPTVVRRNNRPRGPARRRTSRAAALTYYFQTRAQFPIFPPTPQIDFDEPAGENGDAWYRGVNAAGQPIFAVREDFVMTPSTAFHEIGHAYEDLLKRKVPATDFRALYWTHRGFPATWQEALKEANAQPVGMAQWIHLPGESWAEAFSIAMIGGGREKTLDYGRTINPPATKSFFLSLITAPNP